MKKCFLIGLVFVVCGAVVFASGSGEGEAVTPKRIAINHITTDQHPWERACQAFAKYVNERTEGRYNATTHPNGQLVQGNWQIMYEMIQAGTTQMGVEGLSSMATLNNDLRILTMPFVFQDSDHMYRFLNAKIPVYEKWMDQFAKYQITVIAVAPRPMRQLSNNLHPIKTPADMQGVRFRVPQNELFITIFEGLGAKPVPMSSTEIYTGIQLGTVNGEDNSIQTQYDSKTYEVAKFYTIWNYVADGAAIFMNKGFYDSATPEDRKIFSEAGQKFVETATKEDAALYDIAYKAMEKAGVQFYVLNDTEKEVFKKKLSNFYATWQAKYPPEDWKAFFDGAAATAKK